MEKVKLGEMLDHKDVVGRDAIHMAIIPVVAMETLHPGQEIGFCLRGDTTHVGVVGEPIGIVDPFLKKIVSAGERFYMMMFPNTITGLRHEWTHPALERGGIGYAETHAASEKWLRAFAKEFAERYTYDELLAELVRYAREKEAAGLDEDVRWNVPAAINLNFDTPDIAYKKAYQMWQHVEVVTGIRIKRENREQPFSCSC